MKDLGWFKLTIEPILKQYQLGYIRFEKGDFGSLDQIRFESSKLGGSVDFWGQGWIGIFMWDYKAEIEIMNVLLEPHQKREVDEAFEKLKNALLND
jgi:hypothetical protein